MKLLESTIATYQTLKSAERLAKFDPHQLKAVIVDEAHHAAAPSYVIIQNFRVPLSLMFSCLVIAKY